MSEKISLVLGDENEFFHIFKIAETREEVDATPFPEDGDVVNVISLVKENEEPTYFAVINGAWKEVIVGSHKHENISLLNTISKLNVESSDGEYVLGVHNVEGELNYGWFPLEYVEKDTNIQAPAQTYKKIVINVDSDTNHIILENVVLNDDDSIMIYVNKLLYMDSDYSMSTEDNDTIITSEEDIFEAGSVITIVIFSNGVDGFLNRMGDEYLSKKEALEYLSRGTFTVNDLLTKKDLKFINNGEIEANQIILSNNQIRLTQDVSIENMKPGQMFTIVDEINKVVSVYVVDYNGDSLYARKLNV